MKKDNDFSIPENEIRWNRFLSVKTAWETYNPDIFKSILTDDFKYISMRRLSDIEGRKSYIEYISKRFSIGIESGFKPIVPVVFRKYRPSDEYTYALFIEYMDDNTVLLFTFNGDKISQLHMIESWLDWFYWLTVIPSGRIGMLDKNGEPMMFKYEIKKK